MFKLYRKLSEIGLLSINQRNAGFVLPYNDRKLYPIVDDKLKTKHLALEHGIDVPKLYAVIDSEQQVPHIETLLDKYDDFVIKPAHGAGGDGIMVITDKVKGHYRKSSGALITTDDIEYHLSCTLSGADSLGGHPDKALIEHRVNVDPVFESISYEGVPDIRIIVVLGYPAMAMVRLPTRMSDGKANLHQGAIGVGVDLATGLTLGGVWHNDKIDYHPDTLNDIVGIKVPFWDEMLNISASCYELTGLGYLGVDLVLDKDHGPLMLELNARPGLNIQIANRDGLLHRYRSIEKQALKKEQVAERISFSVTNFGHKS